MRDALLLLLLGFAAACSGAAEATSGGDAPAAQTDVGAAGPAAASPPTAAEGVPALPLAFEKSFVVVDHASLSAIEGDFTMGKLLYGVNQHITSVVPAWNAAHPNDTKKVHNDSAFALSAFEVASKDITNHNASGPVHVGTVAKIVDTFAERILPRFDPQTNSAGPFRLLAVINRLDLAGDMDLRGGGELAGSERRWFGEARLVFGLREPFDPSTPFPMTFIMEYRLPALKLLPTGAVVLDPDFDPARGPESSEEWIARRKLWGQVWLGLSSYELGSPAYTNKLREVVALFTGGKNHLAMRSGELVRDKTSGAFTNEYEYREFYLNGQWMLSTRKLRREPFACSQGSATLAARIQAEWNDATSAMNWNYTMGERNLEDAEIGEIKATCGGELPYGQFDEDRKGTQLRAKFARFKADTVWRVKTDEARRHQFALGTCTGCHSAETNTVGFHVAPSLSGQDASLSAFLAGKTSAAPGGTAYEYDEPARRMALVREFLGGVDVPGAALHELQCTNVDTCIEARP